ncbi:MAG TPA: VWA domain-containing protein [Thermoanaerobaculia bacterium]|nr:VWA domain-containing protein [Thermoanaerobaculia bacterium]
MHRIDRHPRLTLGLALALASAPAFAQKNAGVVQEKASVTVIEVPVNVLGKDGKPLAGLTAADFELYDNGKKQEITGFDVADLRPPAAEAVNPFLEPPPAAARRHWFLIFDLSYASPTALIRAREGARSFVEKEMGPSDLAGVGTISIEKGWKLVENFTSDRVQLRHAIDTLGLVKSGVRTSDPLSFALLQPGELLEAAAQSERDAAIREYFADTARMVQGATDQLERGRIATHMGSLGQIAQVLDSVRGRKYVLLFSEGFESRLLMGNAGQTAKPLGQIDSTQDISAESSISGQTWKIDSDARFGSSATRGFIENALSGFRKADVVLDTIDISGLRAEGEVTRRAGSGADALFTMARETNGDFIRNANQLSGDLKQLIERTDIVYVLAFQPKELSKPGAYHELKVKVRVPASKISARSGYYEPRPYRNLTPMERVLASGDLLSGGGGSQLPVSMLAAPFATTEKVAQVPVILEIPGKALLEGDTSSVTGVLIYAYASDSRGVLTDYLTQEITLDLKLARAKLETGGIKYYGTLFLPPGQYTLRALVRNAFTGRSALSTAALTVPSTPGGAPTVNSFFFQDPAAPWAMVKPNPRPSPSAGSLEYPFAIGGDAFIPAALPVLASGSAAQVAVVTYNFAPGSDPLQVLPEIIGPGGKTLNADIQVVRRSDRERGGARALLLSFKPEGLEPGRYSLRVRISDRAQKTAEASGGFEVRNP